jgi:bifunctional ADP-heptose synthase (sugar kinase/adenylyltransferase)
MLEKKVIPFEQAHAFFQKLRREGTRIVHCHGTFDLVHPGYVCLFEAARARGDVLVVTLPGEACIRDGGERPYFSDALRVKSLAALELVDYVVVIPHPASAAAIDCVRPHFYCRNSAPEAHGAAPIPREESEDMAVLERVGGESISFDYVGFSSAKLINNFFKHLPEEVKAQGRVLAEHYSPGKFRAALDAFAKLRVLVVGDTIFDRYSYVKVQGLTSKNRIMSGRFLKEHTDPGGGLAVARHIRQFTPHVRMVSMVGTEPWVDAAVGEHLSEEEDLFVRDSRITTVLKQRYVEPVSDEKEMAKLFSVNYIDAGPPPPEVVDKVLHKLTLAMRDVDLVVVTDFGHGLMAQEVRELVQAKAPFLALNCQTNSNNHGFNIISHQYRRCDCFSLDEQEILLSCARRGIDHGKELEALRERMGARYAWLTRGGVETIGLDDHRNETRCPPLELAVTDTVGAGDAFFSVVALAAAQGLPVNLATLLGQLAGGQAVKIVGNSEPISKEALLKSGLTLLGY